MLPSLTLVLGGAASGKSLWAENLIVSKSLTPTYLATSRIYDAEIEFKVTVHRNRRDSRWRTLEADTDLAVPLAEMTGDDVVLIDCATMWLTNHMMDDGDLAAAQTDLLATLDGSAARIVIVSNEVGHGIVPDNAMARTFREAQGRLNIALAAQAGLVVLVTAGLPQILKGTLP